MSDQAVEMRELARIDQRANGGEVVWASTRQQRAIRASRMKAGGKAKLSGCS
jgi:hypothetical protein